MDKKAMYYTALVTKSMTKKMGCNTTDAASGLALVGMLHKPTYYKQGNV
jgi:hypothetical protein